MTSKLAHPEIQKAWRDFMEVARKYHPGDPPHGLLPKADIEALKALDDLIDPACGYDDDGVLNLDKGFTPSNTAR